MQAEIKVESTEVTLKSGKKLVIWLSEFLDGHKLFKAVAKELQGIDLKEDTVQSLSMHLISSEAIEGALWPCMDKATYDGQHVTKETFRSLDARKDFMEIVKEVMVYNLTPFSENVGSLCKAVFQKDISILE